MWLGCGYLPASKKVEGEEEGYLVETHKRSRGTDVMELRQGAVP